MSEVNLDRTGFVEADFADPRATWEPLDYPGAPDINFPEDSNLWTRLIKLAIDASDLFLARALWTMRIEGTNIVAVTRYDTQGRPVPGYKLEPAIDPGGGKDERTWDTGWPSREDYIRCADAWLGPRRELLVRLLEKLAEEMPPNGNR